VHEHVAIAPVQILLAQGRASGDPAPLHRALALLERQRVEAERFGLTWCRIKALALQALAYQALGEDKRSRGALEEALRLGQPEGYIRVLADEGEPLASLLATFLHRHERGGTERAEDQVLADYAKQVLAVTGTSQHCGPHVPRAQDAGSSH
jgi:hypothetical protein